MWGRAPTLQINETEVIVMKTSNLVALIVALLITTGGFEGINLLFMKASSAHERPPVSLVVHA